MQQIKSVCGCFLVKCTLDAPPSVFTSAGLFLYIFFFLPKDHVFQKLIQAGGFLLEEVCCSHKEKKNAALLIMDA